MAASPEKCVSTAELGFQIFMTSSENQKDGKFVLTDLTTDSIDINLGISCTDTTKKQYLYIQEFQR